MKRLGTRSIRSAWLDFLSSMHKCLFIPFKLAQPHQARATFYHRRVYACYRSDGLFAHCESTDEEELARDVEEGGEEGKGVDCEVASQRERRADRRAKDAPSGS